MSFLIKPTAVPGFLAARASLLLTFGLVALFERLVTLEWSLPYCMNPEDGPAHAAAGLPLPYETYGGVSSMEFAFMPHVYLANLAILSLLAYPIVRVGLRRIGRVPGLRAAAAHHR